MLGNFCSLNWAGELCFHDFNSRGKIFIVVIIKKDGKIQFITTLPKFYIFYTSISLDWNRCFFLPFIDSFVLEIETNTILKMHAVLMICMILIIFNCECKIREKKKNLRIFSKIICESYIYFNVLFCSSFESDMRKPNNNLKTVHKAGEWFDNELWPSVAYSQPCKPAFTC